MNELETVLMVPAHDVLGVPNALWPAGLVPYDEITSALLNHYRVITASDDSGAGGGGNVSCALVADAFTLGLTDSTEDDEKTLCDPANAVDLTDFNFDAEWVGFRDADPAAYGVFNLFRDLTFGPDAPYLLVHRVGFAADVAFASGQEVDIYFALTDNQVPVSGDGETLKVSETFIAKNVVKISFELAS